MIFSVIGNHFGDRMIGDVWINKIGEHENGGVSSSDDLKSEAIKAGISCDMSLLGFTRDTMTLQHVHEQTDIDVL